MWSIERIDQPEAEEKDSDTDPQKVKVKVIRIKPTTAPMMVEEEDEDLSEEIKEQGYILGAKGNQSEVNFLHTVLEIEKTGKALGREYDEVNKRTSKQGNSEIEGILRRQIDLDREKIKAYEKAYIQEKILRMRAIHELRKHEERVFGELNDIPGSRGRTTHIHSSQHSTNGKVRRRSPTILERK